MYNPFAISFLATSIACIFGFGAYNHYSTQSRPQPTNINQKTNAQQATSAQQNNVNASTRPMNSVSVLQNINNNITSTPTTAVNSGSYQLGAGIADITGEVAEANMFGYADSDQVSTGVQQRLHARAFVIGDGAKEVLMVILDSGMVSQALHQKLLSELQKKYGDRFNEKNVVFTATHTHSAPGGYSHYFLYGLTTRGFQEATFNAIVRGSVRAVDKAVKSQSTGDIEFGTSELTNASVQRSHDAYAKNSDAANNAKETDTLMQVLKFVKQGKDVASVNWFAVHPTNLTSNNTLVSGDNKGYAAWYWETQKGMNYLTGEGYIAGFANSNPGDMSPNLNLKPGSGPTDDQWQNAKILGQRQADSAMNTVTDTKVAGSIDYRQNYVDFSKNYVDPQYTIDGKAHTTCPAAYKTAFAAGSTEDGGGGDELVASNLVDEGRANPLISAIGYTLFWPSKELIACHESDQVAITMGTVKPNPMSPEVLPTQVIRIGNLAMIAVPSEFTVMAGQRIRKKVAERLNIPYENVIFTGYSNAYAGYITTPEEYSQQDYEGASTHFGPHTQEAWLQNVDHLTLALINNRPVKSEATPRYLGKFQMSSVTGVVFDNTPFRVEFGDIATQPQASYNKGDKASSIFWSSHPKSTLAYEEEVDNKGQRKVEPYTMAVQRKEGGKWVTVATDNDWNTTNEWKRIVGGQSQATLNWDIPQDAKAGEYRMYHRGAYKNGWNGKHIPFNGVSQSFTVN